MLCCILLYCTVQYSTVRYCNILYCTVLYNTVHYCCVLYHTVYCIVLYYTIMYCFVLYSTCCVADSISECLCVGVVGIAGISARVSALYRGRGELYTGWAWCYSCVLALKLIKVFRKTDNKIDCIGVNTH